jgi:hypothetical protein
MAIPTSENVTLWTNALADEDFTSRNRNNNESPLVFHAHEFNNTATGFIKQTISDTVERVAKLSGAREISIS